MISETITTIIASLGLGGVGGWFFGGRQNHNNTVNNDSHKREKEFFDLVDSRAEKEISKQTKRIIKFAKKCPHSGNCPVCDLLSDDD